MGAVAKAATVEEENDSLPDRDLLEELVRALVSKPGCVNVQETQVAGGGTSVLRISVDPCDTGKVIGKAGRTADAIRTIFQSIASFEGRRVFIEVDEPGRIRRAH